MSFAAPIWLFGLVPWTALAAWLLTGRRAEARVPFVHLWPTSAAPVRTRRSMQAPPIALVCLLLAVLLAVLAAAQPQVARSADARLVTLVVDLGVTSPLKDLGNLELKPARVLLVNADKPMETDASDWRDASGTLTSIPTVDAVRAAVNDALASDDRPVVVVSNQRLDIDDGDARVIQITSPSPLENVGIAHVAARGRQVMVTVRNQSSRTSAELVVASEGTERRQPIELPPRGGETSFFVEPPTIGRVVSVELRAPDDVAVDNRAWLVRQPTSPELEPRGDLPAELTRVIDAYRKLRPSGDGSRRVAVTTSPADGPAALLASGGASDPVPPGRLQVADHPVTANVEWSSVVGGVARTTERPAGGGWTPIVSAGEHALVAVREEPARQVWVGFDSDTWPRDASFVIFWTNVFEWLGHGGAEEFVAEPVQRLSSEWRRLDELSGSPALPVDSAPGIYGRRDGAMRALNAIDLTLDPPPPSDWRARLAATKPSPGIGANLSRPALVAALFAALIASLTWASVNRGATPT
jgi:hypothetical protein